MSKVLVKIFTSMSIEERHKYMASARSVTVGEYGKVEEKRFVTYYVARVRGIIVSSDGKWLFKTKDEAREHGKKILAGWKLEATK